MRDSAETKGEEWRFLLEILRVGEVFILGRDHEGMGERVWRDDDDVW